MADHNDQQLQIKERNVQWQAKKARDYLLKKNPAKALEELERANGIIPDHPVVLYFRGIAHCSLENFPQAVRDLDIAISNYQITDQAYSHRAEAHYRLKNFAAAADDAQKALDLNPNNFLALLVKGKCCSEKGDEIAALELFKRAVSILPNHYIGHYDMAIALTRLEYYHEALDAYNKAASIYPNDPNVIYYRACVKNKLGDAIGAEQDLAHCRKLGMAAHTYLTLPVPENKSTANGSNP